MEQKPLPPVGEPSVKVKPGEGIMTGKDYEKAITNLMEMGFERKDVEKALKAAFGNPERATDYLLNVLSLLSLREFLLVSLICRCHTLGELLLCLD